MDILMTTEYFIRSNGVSNVVFNLAKEFSKKHNVFIAAYSNKIDKVFSKELNVIPLKKSINKFGSLLYLNRIIKKIDPDVVHSHTCLGFGAKLSRQNYIATYHGWGLIDELIHGPGMIPIKLFWSFPMYLLTLKNASVVTTVSNFIKEKLLSFGIEAKVIPNGISKEIILKKSSKRLNSKLNLLFVGSITKRKGAHLLPKIVNIMHHSGIDLHLDVVGRPINKGIVNSLKNNKLITYHGVVEDVIPLYDSADFLLFPSLYENFSITILESLARGVPVITWNKEPFNEIISHKFNGFLANEINDFGKKLKSFIEEVDYKSLSMNSLKKVKEYTWGKISKQYLSIYKLFN